MTPDTLRYPIGPFQGQDHYSPEERASHLARIAGLPAALATALDGLGEADFGAPYRPGGWTVGQLVHHIADSHVNAYIRVKLGLTEDNPTIKPYDQDAWVALADANRVSPHISVAMLAATHVRLSTVLADMSPEQFARTLMHPENGSMTLDRVAALYAWHGDHHVAQIVGYKSRRG